MGAADAAGLADHCRVEQLVVDSASDTLAGEHVLSDARGNGLRLRQEARIPNVISPGYRDAPVAKISQVLAEDESSATTKVATGRPSRVSFESAIGWTYSDLAVWSRR